MRVFSLVAAPLLLSLSLSAQTGRVYAVAAGVSKYDDRGLPWLKYAGRDAALFETWVAGTAANASSQVSLLQENRVTLASLRETLRDVLTVKAGPLDDVYLFLSGRGIGTPDYNAGFILASESKESRPTSTALSTDELGLFIRQSQAKHIFLFADLCREPQSVPRANLIEFKLKDLAGPKSRLTAILASQPPRLSGEVDQWKYGAFAYLLVKGLREGHTNIPDLIDFLKQQLPAASPTHQTPWQFGPAVAPLRTATLRAPQFKPLFIPAFYPQDESADNLQNSLLTAVETDPDRANQLYLAASPAIRARERIPFAIALEDRGQKVLVKYGEGDQFPDEPGRPGKQDFELAGRAFELAANLQDDPGIKASLEARSLFGQGRALLFGSKTSDTYNKALDTLSRAASKQERYPESYNAIGIAQLEQGHYAEAIDGFNNAIRRAPDWAYPRHNLALTYIELGDYAAAERAYREAIKRTPYHPYLYYNLGIMLHRVNRKNEAKTEYLLAVEAFHRQEMQAAEREQRARADGDTAHTALAADRLATLRKNEAESHDALGALLQAQGHIGKARAEYELARHLDPDLVLATYNEGTMEYRHNPAQAVLLWKETLTKNPDYVPSMVRLAEDSFRHREFLEAARWYSKVQQLQTRAEVKAKLALAEACEKRFTPACKLK